MAVPRVPVIKTFFLLTIATLGACAPSLKTHLNVGAIPRIEIEKGRTPAVTVPRLRIESFGDSRSANFIAEIDGRKLAPEGDIGESVRYALQRYFTERGSELALFNAPILQGVVREWHVTIKPAFPSTKIEALASVDISVATDRGQILYRATYSGETIATEPLPSQRVVEKMLGTAMSQALKEAVHDENLLSALATAPAGGIPMGSSW